MNPAHGQRAVEAARKPLRKLRDTRRRRGKRFDLVDVVLISLIGMLCGCDDADDIADWAELQEEQLGEWGIDVQHGTPSQDTVLRVFEAINPQAFGRAVSHALWRLQSKLGRHIAVDGKTLRGSRDAASSLKGLHMVSAWLCNDGVSLGQVKTEDKSNEITAIPELLEIIDVRESIVTIDAGGCHKAIAATIVEKGGAYILTVKDNQKTLYEDLQRLFSDARSTVSRKADDMAKPALTRVRDVDSGHGRIEERTLYMSRDLSWLTTAGDWRGLCGVAMLETTTTDSVTGQVSHHKRYLITSDTALVAAQFLALTRAHWQIESHHWVLDVVFDEDGSRIRSRRAAENFSSLRRMAVSLLKSAPPPPRPRGKKPKRLSFPKLRMHCAMRPDYLLTVLGSVGAPLAPA